MKIGKDMIIGEGEEQSELMKHMTHSFFSFGVFLSLDWISLSSRSLV